MEPLLGRKGTRGGNTPGPRSSAPDSPVATLIGQISSEAGGQEILGHVGSRGQPPRAQRGWRSGDMIWKGKQGLPRG